MNRQRGARGRMDAHACTHTPYTEYRHGKGRPSGSSSSEEEDVGDESLEVGRTPSIPVCALFSFSL